MINRDILIRGYSQAGNEFLADELGDVFKVIENDDDRAVHNRMIKRIAVMVGLDKSMVFRMAVAETIIQMSVRNLNNGEARAKKEK
jgi:hypothetical protein